MMLLTNYQVFLPCSFRQEDFFMFVFLAYVNHGPKGII